MRPGGIVTSHFNGRPRAFALIEWMLYCHTGGTLLSEVRGSLGDDLLPRDYAGSIAIMVGFAILVLARNYMVMHSIDNRDRHPAPELRFLDHNLGLEDFAERVLRALIVIVVVISPKRLLFGLPEAVVGAVDRLYGAGLARISMTEAMTPRIHSEAFTALSYYGAVLLILFVLFILWDVSGMWAVGRGVRRDLTAAPTIEAESLPAVVSAIDYMNSARSGDLDSWSLRRVRAGNVLAIYIWSAKARERYAGLFCSILMIVSALSGLSPIIVVVFGAGALGYLVSAHANGRAYWKGLGAFIIFPGSYLFTIRGMEGSGTRLMSAILRRTRNIFDFRL